MAGTIQGVDTNNATAEFSFDGGVNWQELPGASGYTESGGEAPVNEQPTFSGTVRVQGTPRFPTVSLTAVFNPALAVFASLRDAYADGDLVRFRLTTVQRTLDNFTENGDTVAVDTDGDLTFMGNKPDFTSGEYGPGSVIVAGNRSFVINSVDTETGVATVEPPAAELVATPSYSVVIPSLRRTYSCKVGLTDRAEAATESAFTTTINLSPQSAVLPNWEIVIT